MKKKIVDLYENNLHEFMEFVMLFYDVEDITNIYVKYKHPMFQNEDEKDEIYFHIGDMVYSVDALIEDIHSTQIRSQILKDYNLI